MTTPISEATRKAAWKAYATAMNHMVDGLNLNPEKAPHEESIAFKEALEAALDSANPTPKEGATPETDAEQIFRPWEEEAPDGSKGRWTVSADFARSLELRLAEKVRDVEVAWKEAKKWQDIGSFLDARKDELTQEVAALRSENERLKSAHDDAMSTVRGLEFENERLTKELGEARHHLGDHTRQLVDEVDNRVKLEGEIESIRTRLRELEEDKAALVNEVAYFVGNPSAWGRYCDETSDSLRRIVESHRAARKGETQS